jgi:hypothetical protein
MRTKLRNEPLSEANNKKKKIDEINYQRLAQKMHKGYFSKPK